MYIKSYSNILIFLIFSGEIRTKSALDFETEQVRLVFFTLLKINFFFNFWKTIKYLNVKIQKKRKYMIILCRFIMCP